MKLFRKISAVLSAMLIVLSFTACDGTNEPETTLSTSAQTGVTEEVTTQPIAEETTAEESATVAPVTEESTIEEGTTAPTTTEKTTSTKPVTTKPTTTQKPTTTKKPTTTEKRVTAPTSKSDIVKLYNTAAAAAASSKPGYKKSTQTALSNLDMGALASISAVRDAVGSFLGEGSTSATVSKGKFDGKSLVKSSLKASDVKSATCKLSDDGKYYIVNITVINETNPKKSSSALGRFTKDFKDIDEVKAGLSDVGASVD